MKPIKAQPHDISNGLAILIQSLVVQLMDNQVLTVEQGQRVFDAAEKKAKQASPEAAHVVRAVRDVLPWDKLYEAAAKRRKK